MTLRALAEHGLIDAAIEYLLKRVMLGLAAGASPAARHVDDLHVRMIRRDSLQQLLQRAERAVFPLFAHNSSDWMILAFSSPAR